MSRGESEQDFEARVERVAEKARVSPNEIVKAAVSYNDTDEAAVKEVEKVYAFAGETGGYELDAYDLLESNGWDSEAALEAHTSRQQRRRR